MVYIKSVSLPQLEEMTSPTYLKHRARTKALQSPTLLRCYANTVITRVPSSKFDENSTYWHQYILFEDFYTTAKDKNIPLKDAIEYAVNHGDVHIFCDCPAWLYWAYKYYATTLDYTYGGYKEHRAPTRNNPNMESMLCKHMSKVLEYLQENIDELVVWFQEYYKKDLKKPAEIPADTQERAMRYVSDTPRYTSHAHSDNDVSIGYKVDDQTTYFPTEEEHEEIMELANEVPETIETEEIEVVDETPEETTEDTGFIETEELPPAEENPEETL